MRIIDFPGDRRTADVLSTTSAAGYPCPGFCQLPAEHSFVTDNDAPDLPYRRHEASFGGATARRIEYLGADEGGCKVSSWDGQPDLPDVHHRHDEPPWTPWEAVEVSRDLSALTNHIAQHHSREGAL